MKHSLADVMERVSGIPKAEVNEIWEQVKKNHLTLDACVGPHDFSIEGRKQGVCIRSYRCTKCGGEIDSTDRRWYLDGLKHGQESRS